MTDSHGSAYVQLAVLWRQHHIRITHISFHVRMAVRRHRDTPKGSVSPDHQRQHITVVFHHASHHGAGRQKPPQSRCGYRAGVVMLSGLFHQISGCGRKGTYLAVCRRRSYNIVFLH